MKIKNSEAVRLRYFVYGGFYKFISGDFEICFEQIAARRESLQPKIRT